MNKLPIETYGKIFQLLPQKALYECTLVCHLWLNTARPHLYSRICLTEENRFEQLMNTVDMEPSFGNFVTRLDLNKQVLGFDLQHMYYMFPRLKHFSNSEPTYWAPHALYETTATPLTSTLESISGEADCYEFTRYLIRLSLCTRLEKLDLHNLKMDELNSSPFSQLRSMPNLVELVLDLSGFILKVQDIEMLHQNISSIQTLKITTTTLAPFGERFVNMVPNTTVRSIDLTFHDISTTQDLSLAYIQCLRYIEQKYQNITDLYILYEDYENFTDEEKLHIFDQGWLPLLQSKGPQLKLIRRIGIPSGVDIFEILDDHSCNIESLEIFSPGGKIDINKLAHSNQRHSLHQLFVQDALHFHEASLRDTKLVDLSIMYSIDANDGVIILNDLLTLFPSTLTNLSLSYAALEVNKDDNNHFQSSVTSFFIYLIEKFSAHSSHSEKEIYRTVKEICPNIKKINIDNPSSHSDSVWYYG